MSAEQTSQMYFAPPSVPREPVFFIMTPMLPLYCGQTAASREGVHVSLAVRDEGANKHVSLYCGRRRAREEVRPASKQTDSE